MWWRHLTAARSPRMPGRCCWGRRIGLVHTQFATATCGTIRLKLLKIGALVRVSVRRIKIAMASGCPYQYEFGIAQALLGGAT